MPILTWSSHGTLSQNFVTVSPFIGHYRRNIILLWRELFARPRTLICLLPVWVVLGSSLTTCIMQNSQTGEHVCLLAYILQKYSAVSDTTVLLWFCELPSFSILLLVLFRDHKQNWVFWFSSSWFQSYEFLPKLMDFPSNAVPGILLVKCKLACFCFSSPVFSSRSEEMAVLRTFSEALVRNLFPEYLWEAKLYQCVLTEIVATKG